MGSDIGIDRLDYGGGVGTGEHLADAPQMSLRGASEPLVRKRARAPCLKDTAVYPHDPHEVQVPLPRYGVAQPPNLPLVLNKVSRALREGMPHRDGQVLDGC